MTFNHWSQNRYKSQLQQIIDQLVDIFPDLDLRFNVIEGSPLLRCIAAEFPHDPFEILIGKRNTNFLIQEATLRIRKIAGRLDA